MLNLDKKKVEIIKLKISENNIPTPVTNVGRFLMSYILSNPKLNAPNIAVIKAILKFSTFSKT
jgi:hypothetical protein